MVPRRKTLPAGKRLLANHNRAWIWGRNLITETLRAGRWQPVELAVSRTLEASCLDELTRLADAASVPTILTDDSGLSRLCRADDHQGCAARMTEFPYLPVDNLIGGLTRQSVILVLDRIQDSYNFGAIIRSAECLGVAGIVIGMAGQSGVNSQAARSSAGAVNQLPICRVETLTEFVRQLKSQGWQLWGTSERGAIPLDQVLFQPPLAILIGNEGEGIQAELLSQCTGTVQIPLFGRIGSLNAAVAAGIICYEAVRSCRSIQQK